MIYSLENLPSIELDLKSHKIIFLYGDLGAGKTTLTKTILKNIFGVTENITSPTYTYYNRYRENIYHFDLYRLENYGQFFAIGGEEILDSDVICIIEWPQILEQFYTPDIIITINTTNNENERDIIIEYLTPTLSLEERENNVN